MRSSINECWKLILRDDILNSSSAFAIQCAKMNALQGKFTVNCVKCTGLSKFTIIHVLRKPFKNSDGRYVIISFIVSILHLSLPTSQKLIASKRFEENENSVKMAKTPHTIYIDFKRVVSQF
ncbi:hypothetical protein Trydic_g1393 [Trypoxylus dichotomus]